MNLDYEKEFELYANVVEIQSLLLEIDKIMSVDLGLAIRTVSAGLDSVKRIAEIARKTQNTELREEILNLKEQLLEMKTGLLEAKEEISNLKEEKTQFIKKIKELENKKEEPQLVVKENLYYKQDGDGPFCTGCFDTKKTLVRMNQFASIFTCPACKATAM